MKRPTLTQTIFGLLIVQFVLGMLANLYATIPKHKPYDVFHQLGLINLHGINGTVLLILSVMLAVKSRGTATARPARGGAACIVLAFAFGELFVFTQQDIFSLLMALVFLGAFAVYAKLLFSKP
jgi:heme/copper-type cytochrome/quinol oxidase subunit 3